MTEHVLEAYSADFETRKKDRGLFSVGAFPEGHAVNAHEIEPGIVYKDANVTVTAFATPHAMESYGYRFDTPGRRIVISGDTNPTQATIDACSGCDVLIHEVNTLESLARRDARFQAFAAKYHTSTEQLADLATKAKPKLLVIYHHSIALRPGITPTSSYPDQLQREISAKYAGQFVIGRDLDVY
jgi:ribonuclease Z